MSMTRSVWLSAMAILLILSSAAEAAQTHKRAPRGWHGYGFLPGYRQPLSNSQPVFERRPGRNAVRVIVRGQRRPWYIGPTPAYLGYDGNFRYFGRPGFYGGRYNGGSFGPCWTKSPIGPVWNCG